MATKQMPYSGDATTFPLHAAAADGRLSELAAQLTALGADLAKPKHQLAAVAAAVVAAAGTANAAKIAIGKPYSSPSRRSLPWAGF